MSLMHLADEFADMERAEDLFARYQVTFDPRILIVHRVRILKRFGERAAAIALAFDPAQGEERRSRLAQALAEVHEQFARGDFAERMRPDLDRNLVQIRRPIRAGGP